MARLTCATGLSTTATRKTREATRLALTGSLLFTRPERAKTFLAVRLASWAEMPPAITKTGRTPLILRCQ